MKLVIVTATLDLDRAQDCIASWAETAGDVQIVVIPDVFGTVPAFASGVQQALKEGAEIIACFHDDLLLEPGAQGWDQTVEVMFQAHPQIGLMGFGGATGLGASDIYQKPYAPMQLARQRFGSNMRDAEAHGERWTTPRRVACLDGFSQIGRREFWEGQSLPGAWGDKESQFHDRLWQAEFGGSNLFSLMQSWGVIHHFYDGMLGCFAKRLGWETWFLPIPCHHFGGRTAVGDPRYQEWVASRMYQRWETNKPPEVLARGDAAVWEQAHQIGYDQFKDVLPIRV